MNSANCKHINKGLSLSTCLKGKPNLSKTIHDNLFEEIVAWENIEWAYKKSLKGVNKYGSDALYFSKNETYNLMKLIDSLRDGTYEFEGYKRFKVYEPKERIIDAPYHKDKIAQLAIDRVLKSVYQPSFIYDSYACLDNKGTHKAVERVSYFMRKAAWQYGEDTFIIKLDIRKFFYSINREILKNIIPKKVKCQDTLDLVNKIIDSADLIDPLGLPLGNTLSQLFTNVYMDRFDQYCKRILRIKYYVRYADDVIAIVRNKDEAATLLDAMIRFLKDELDLDISVNKTRIFPLEQGVNAYGFKIHKTHRLLRNDSKKKIKRKAKRLRKTLSEGRITPGKVEQILNSWNGHARYGCSHNFIQRLIARNDYIYVDHKGILKVDMSKIAKEGILDVVS